MASDPVPPSDRSPYPSPYAQYPPYQPYPPYSPYPPPEPATNVLAIVGFITSFFVGLAGIICGHIALSQIRRTGEKGRGLALAATIIGYAQVALLALWIGAVVIIVAISSVGHFATAAGSDAPVAPSSECTTLQSAAQALSTALTTLQSSDWKDRPADAKTTLLDEWSTFDGATSSLQDQKSWDAIDTTDNDLSALSTALVDYEAAAPGQGDASAVASAFTQVEDGLHTLMSSCG
ncbi:DUF4190 domain-containing protein [Leifsonia sp. NPDC056824]|uniref:DUF4190 domain-containing protein n=1 Tax=Leifsonia sp. NPDC056824 TaxID=3345953 RepID=UPI0036AC923A